MKYTKYGYRINPLKEAERLTWIFLPGGPGLGSEYLEEFCLNLNLPGSIILADFPKDGTNTHGELALKLWQDGLIDLVKSYENVILVTHSFSGMFALFNPELENLIKGLVIMNSTNANTFFDHLSKVQKQYNLPDLMPSLNKYHSNPSQEGYRDYWDIYKHYCYTSEEMSAGEKMMEIFAYNNISYNLAIEKFYPIFESKWVPNNIPTLTIASDKDFVCPHDVFIKDNNFNRPNIINRIISEAGHCPWINQLSQVQGCFNEFLNLYNRFKDT